MWREQAITEWSRWSDLGEWPLIMLVKLVNSLYYLLMVMARVNSWSLLLLAATVWSFAHLPLGLSDRNSGATHSGSVYSASWGTTCAGTILPSFEHSWLKWSCDKYNMQRNYSHYECHPGKRYKWSPSNICLDSFLHTSILTSFVQISKAFKQNWLWAIQQWIIWHSTK